MKHRCVALLALVFLAAAPFAGRADPVAAGAFPEADALLRGCIDALPDIPLLITGELVGRTRAGDEDRRMHVEMLLDWQAEPSTARYTLRDNFGRSLSHLSITWPTDQPAEFRFLTGEPLAAAPPPVLSNPIEGTDISWTDLSLSFLWWPGGRTVGAESVRGRSCWIVDVVAPPDQAPCAMVRLWIDPQIHIMLKAESYDASATLLRRLQVKSFKKINDRWVIKDIEIEGLPSRHKTYLRIRDVEDRTRKQFVPVDEGGPDETATDNIYEQSVPAEGGSDATAP
jgi:hypothetical protein